VKFTFKKTPSDSRQGDGASTDRDRLTSASSEESLDRSGRLRRRLLAIWLPITALLYMGTELLNPKGTDQLITTTATALKVLPIAAKHSSQLYLSGSVTEIALAALAASYFAIATLVRRRGSTLATIAAIVGAVGAFCGVVANMFGGINLAVVSTARLTNLQAARFLTTSFNSSTGKTFLDVYVFSEFLAPVLMFVALWRSRLVPRWLTILFVVGFELAEQTPSAGTVRVVAMMALFVVSMTLLAVWIWRSAGSRDAQAIDASN
jgi:hypothetical protein